MASSSDEAPQQVNFMDTPVSINFNDPTTHHDRILIVEGEKFYVLKEVLSLSSEFFRGLFNGNFAENNQQEIQLPDVSARNFEIFLILSYPVQYRRQVNLSIINPSILLELVSLSFRFLSPAVYQEVKRAIEAEIMRHGLLYINLTDFIELVLSHDFEFFKGEIIEALKDPAFTHGKIDEIMHAPENVKDFVLFTVLNANRPVARVQAAPRRAPDAHASIRVAHYRRNRDARRRPPND